MKTSSLPVTQKNNTLYLEMNDYLEIEGNGDNIASFLLEFIENTIVDVTFSRFLSGNIETVIGELQLKKFPINITSNITGMSNLENVTVLSYDIPSDAEDGVSVNISVNVFNPSTISVDLGTSYLEILYQNVYLGNVVSRNVSLYFGWNKLSMYGTLRPRNLNMASFKKKLILTSRPIFFTLLKWLRK